MKWTEFVGPDAFYDEYIAPSITTFISHRFEEICRNYFSSQVQSRKLTGVLNIGTYYYGDSKTKTNGEFDAVLERKNNFDVYEVKYLSEPTSNQQIEKEAKKIRAIKGLFVGKIGFISVNGFESMDEDYIYLDGEDLYA